MGMVPDRYQRFNDDKYWRDVKGEYHVIASMETSHIINCVRMCINKPSLCQSMMIEEVEGNPCIVPPQARHIIGVITSQTNQQTIDAVLNSRLFNAFKVELEYRGVNWSMLIKNTMEDKK